MYSNNTTSSLAVLLSILPATALAHHSLLAFDSSQIAEFEGEVEDVFWRNPHARITVRAEDEGGDERIWTVEGASVNAMERAGINQAVVGVGDQVSLAGHPSNSTEGMVRPVLLTLADGQSFVLDEDSAVAFGLASAASRVVQTGNASSTATAADLEAEGIFRVWTNRDRHWIRDARNWWAREHPLTASARVALTEWDEETDDYAAQCIPAGLPEAMLMPFPIEFIDQGDTIVLNIEEWDNSRTIYLDADPDAEVEYTRLGYSVGRWEGDTLHVETKRVNYPYFNDQGIPQTDAVEIVEAFTLSENDTRLDWTATLTDPGTFTEPVALPEMHWDWIPGQAIKPYNCVVDEGGQRRPGGPPR